MYDINFYAWYVYMYVSHFIMCRTLLHMYTVCVGVQHLGMLCMGDWSEPAYVVALAWAK